MAREQPSTPWLHLSDDNSVPLPETIAPNPRTDFSDGESDQSANDTVGSAQSMNGSQSDAIASSPDASNALVADFQVPTAQPTLTTALIESDHTCMTSIHIVSLLESIWRYSSTHAALPAATIEVVAGHRYWLPNNLLAEEWMMFFLFVPRLLDAAPPEVRAAFEGQVYKVIEHWPSFDEIMQEEGYASIPLVRSSSTQFTGLLQVPSSGSDARIHSQPSAVPTSQAAQPLPSSSVVAPQALPLGQSIQHVLQGHTQPAFPLAPIPHIGIAPLPNVTVFPLQSIPSGAAAFEQNPAAPLIFDQLLQARGITDPGFRPGSIVPDDNGNKAWSAERIRAFVEIQHNSIHQLPDTAFSPLGTEMSNFRTPESIDVRNCPFETSLVENFTYLSNICTLNREMCLRARTHWLPMDIARYINYAHNIQTRKIFGRSKIGHHFARAKLWGEARPNHVPTASLRNTSTESGARGPNKTMHDYFLHSMGDGVVRPPQGRNAQMLTRVIEHVRNVTGDRNVRLSEANTYAQRWGIIVPVHEQMNFQNLDVEDRLPPAAFLAMIKVDYRNKFNGEDP